MMLLGGGRKNGPSSDPAQRWSQVTNLGSCGVFPHVASLQVTVGLLAYHDRGEHANRGIDRIEAVESEEEQPVSWAESLVL
jgi:hypothetical protein